MNNVAYESTNDSLHQPSSKCFNVGVFSLLTGHSVHKKPEEMEKNNSSSRLPEAFGHVGSLSDEPGRRNKQQSKHLFKQIYLGYVVSSAAVWRCRSLKALLSGGSIIYRLFSFLSLFFTLFCDFLPAPPPSCLERASPDWQKWCCLLLLSLTFNFQERMLRCSSQCSARLLMVPPSALRQQGISPEEPNSNVLIP